MFLPSIVAVAIPTYLISRKLPEQMDINTPRIRYRGDDTTLTRWQRILMLFVGIGGLWFIPTFHNLTKLPPFVGVVQSAVDQIRPTFFPSYTTLHAGREYPDYFIFYRRKHGYFRHSRDGGTLYGCRMVRPIYS